MEPACSKISEMVPSVEDIRHDGEGDTIVPKEVAVVLPTD